MFVNRAHRNFYHSLPIHTDQCIYNPVLGQYPYWIKPNTITPPDVFIISPHIHEEPEFIILTEGTMSVEIGKKKIILHEGDILLINSYESHMATIDYRGSVDYLYIIIDFACLAGCGKATEEIIFKLRKGQLKFQTLLSNHDDGYIAIKELLTAIHHHNQPSDEINDLMQISRIIRLFAEIFKLGLYKISASNSLDLEFIKDVRNYIEKNYMHSFTTTDISRELSYNKSYFCTLFKRNFATTLTDYMLSYRIDRAITVYRDTKLPLKMIASQVGFTDYCYFSRSFKKHMGVTPSGYFNAP